MSNKPKSDQGWLDVVARKIDSLSGPWFAVMAPLLVCLLIVAQRLESADMLKLIFSVGSLQGLAWAGWSVFLVAIPVWHHALNRARSLGEEERDQLREENARLKELLKKQKKGDLTLESE